LIYPLSFVLWTWKKLLLFFENFFFFFFFWFKLAEARPRARRRTFANLVHSIQRLLIYPLSFVLWTWKKKHRYVEWVCKDIWWFPFLPDLFFYWLSLPGFKSPNSSIPFTRSNSWPQQRIFRRRDLCLIRSEVPCVPPSRRPARQLRSLMSLTSKQHCHREVSGVRLSKRLKKVKLVWVPYAALRWRSSHL